MTNSADLLRDNFMTPEARTELLELNERLCYEYVETNDPLVLEEIAATELLLFNDPDHISACEWPEDFDNIAAL